MDKKAAKCLMEELITKISVWNYNYYILNKSLVDDNHFDIEMKRLESLEKQFPDLQRSDSPTKRVGGSVAEEFTAVEHIRPMLSLDNTYNEAELLDFDLKNKKNLDLSEVEYTLELKYDGLSVSLIYEKGLLKRALTRGNGIKGENITDNIRTIRTIPLRLPSKIDIEVRGEVVMPFKSFDSLNQKREESGEQLFANPRNAAAGSLRLLDSSITAQRKLDICVYDAFIEDTNNSAINDFNNHSEKFEFLKKQGFKVSDHIFICSDIDEVIVQCRRYSELKNSLDFEVDGMVVKINSLKNQKKLGATSKCPRWAKAYKFPSKKVKTLLKDIILQVGKSGAVTPVAILEPVQLAGSLVSRASLHNEDEIRKKDIRINDIVEIEKAGEIIPQVIRSIKEERKGSEIEFRMPAECPSCGGPLTRIENEARFKCTNPSCSAMAVRKIIHFASRDAINMEGLGIRNIEIFFEKGLIRDSADLYELRAEDIKVLPGFGEKSAQKIIVAINNGRNVSLKRFITALNIPYVGKNTSALIAGTFNDIDTIMSADIKALSEINEMGEKTAQFLFEYFNHKDNRQLVQRLLSYINIQSSVVSETDLNKKIENKSFVITGTLESMPRNRASELLIKAGGRVISSVSGKTDYLIAGEKAGSKLKKAVKLGVSILNEQEFLELLNL